jgi:acyl-CoA synthetase (NDP forming)
MSFLAFVAAASWTVDALADPIARVSVLAAQEDRIVELDINPLFVRARDEGAVVADALIITAPQACSAAA